MESVINDPLLRWLYLLDVGYKNDHELEVLSNMTEGMRAFANRYKVSLNDPDLRRMYDYETSAKRDQASRDYNNRMEGRKEGLQEGLLSVVRTMLGNGIGKEVIYMSINAPHSEIDALIAKVQAEH